jgi:hypothetical protein
MIRKSGNRFSEKIMLRMDYALTKLWGTTMLSVDQFLRLISVPAVVAAFLIASQVSGAGIFHHPSAQLASE